jgi:GNAT superfamily N-acetyltransferase
MQIAPLTPDIIESNWMLIESIEKKSGLTPLWDKTNFQSDLSYKWDLSKLLIEGDIIVGYAIISQKTPACAHLHRIIILEEYRCKGYGAYFMEQIILNLPFKYKFFTLKAGNKVAKAFYEKKGFHPIFSSAENDYMVLSRQYD